MQRRYSVTITSFLLFCVLNATYTQAKTEEPEVFQILACGKKASGFQVEGLPGIITALHSVVNCETIMAIGEDTENYFENLRIERADIARDVALLSSVDVENSSLKKFILSSQYPISNEELHVIGYPLGIRKPLLSRGLRVRIPRQQLSNLIPLSFELLRPLQIRNSPSLETIILSIEGHLTHGHSGAPVLNTHHQVVGVANGGLQHGFNEIAWAIPWQDIEWRDFSSEETPNVINLSVSVPFFTEDTTNTTPKGFRELKIRYNDTPMDVISQKIYVNRTAHYILSTPQTINPEQIRNIFVLGEADEILAEGSLNKNLSSTDGRYKYKISTDREFLILEVTYRKLWPPPIPSIFIGTGVSLGVCLATECFDGNDGSSDDPVLFAIVEPQPDSTVDYRYVKVRGVGMKDNVSEFRCLVYTDKWYNQTYAYERFDDGSWETAANLEGQGQYNNHTIRVEVFYSDSTSDSAEVRGIIVVE